MTVIEFYSITPSLYARLLPIMKMCFTSSLLITMIIITVQNHGLVRSLPQNQMPTEAVHVHMLFGSSTIT